MHGEIRKDVVIRIAKYCARGFRLLVPIKFDGDFDYLLEQDEVPLYRWIQQEVLSDDGEIQLATTEFWRQPARNIDVFQVQEDFITNALMKPLDETKSKQ